MAHRVKDRKLIAKAYRAFAKEHMETSPGSPVYPAWEAMLKDRFRATQWGKDLLFADDTGRVHFKLEFE